MQVLSSVTTIALVEASAGTDDIPTLCNAEHADTNNCEVVGGWGIESTHFTGCSLCVPRRGGTSKGSFLVPGLWFQKNKPSNCEAPISTALPTESGEARMESFHFGWLEITVSSAYTDTTHTHMIPHTRT